MLDGKTVYVLKMKLRSHAETAMKVNSQSSFVAIHEAERALYRAFGIFDAVQALGLSDDMDITQEDLELIEAKIQDVLEEKRRSRPVWKH